MEKITGLPLTPTPLSSTRRIASLLTALVGALSALTGSTAIAFPDGSSLSQCTIDPTTMAQVMLSPSVPSPNGWSFNIPATYTPGTATPIAITNADAPTKKFRGILLWLTRPDGVPVGTWTITSGFQPCQSSLMHTSAVAKSQQTFTYFPPSTEASTLTANAVLVEDCGQLNCRSAHTFLTAAMVPSVGVMNVDASAMVTRFDAATDGVLLLRYLFGYTGTALTNGALGSLPSRNAAQIVTHLDSNRLLLDVDGDGAVRALSDGLLILRYLLGLRDTALTTGAALGNLTPDQIAARILIVAP